MESLLESGVLVVEDDRTTRGVVAGYLRRRGYRVEEARDGIDALAVIEREAPHVVVTDLEMPRLDGFGLLRALRRTHPDLPAIILTAHESVEGVLSAIREGILFDFLIKPPDLPVVDIAVRRAAEVHLLRARAREADQVKAMRELAMTAADRILNPCNVISLTLHLLRQKGITADAAAVAAVRIQGAVNRITRVVNLMSRVSRYAPREVAKNLSEIDIERAIAPGPDASETPPQPSLNIASSLEPADR
jgi:CheY-like chemotaxis protein